MVEKDAYRGKGDKQKDSDDYQSEADTTFSRRSMLQLAGVGVFPGVGSTIWNGVNQGGFLSNTFSNASTTNQTLDDAGFFDYHSLSVAETDFDRVELQMYDGATVVFMRPWPDDDVDDDDPDVIDVVFRFQSEEGFSYEHEDEISAALEPYRTYNGPIEQATISTYEGDSRTLNNDVDGAVESVEFTDSTVTVSVVGGELGYGQQARFFFKEAPQESRDPLSIEGSRTFEFPEKIVEAVEFGGPQNYLWRYNAAVLDRNDWKTLTLDGQMTDSRTDYQFDVSGKLEAIGGIGTGDSIDGSSAEGFVNAGLDKYRFTGDLVDYSLDGGDAVLRVDGKEPDGNNSGGGAVGDLDVEARFFDYHTLFVEGPEFDRVELQMYDGATVVFMRPWPDDDEEFDQQEPNETDVVFRFDSEEGDSYEHELEVAAALDSYETYHGPIEQATVSTYEGASRTVTNDVEGAIESVEFIDSTVTASVTSGEFGYETALVSFADGSREVLNPSFRGSQTFDFPGRTVESVIFSNAKPTELQLNNVVVLDGPDWKTLTLDGQMTDSRTDYQFDVSGRLEAVGGLGTGDSIDGSSAEGFVNAGLDKYRFTGDLVDYSLDGGDAVLRVDGMSVN